MKRGLIASLALVGIVLFGSAILANQVLAADVYKIKVQTFQTPTDNWCNLTFIEFAKRCELRSNGRLKILPLLDVGAVCGAGEILDAVGNGMLDGGYTCSVYYMGKVPTGAVDYGLPYGLMGVHEAHEVLHKRGLMEILRKDWARHNVRYVGYIGSTELNWFTKKKPIKTVEDFKGLKLRVTGAAQYAPQKMGAAIVQVAYPELYTSLQQGVIDGALTIKDALTTLRFNEVVKYVMTPAAVFDAMCFVMNMDTWKKLPPDLQQLIEDESIRFSLANTAQSQFEELRAIEKAASMGVQVVEMEPGLVKELRRISIADGWKWVSDKGPLAAEAVGKVQAYMKELGRL